MHGTPSSCPGFRHCGAATVRPACAAPRGTGPPSASFPCGTALGATFDPDLVEEVGRALGREARSKGAHVLLAPTVNLHRTPDRRPQLRVHERGPAAHRAHRRRLREGRAERTSGRAASSTSSANDTEFERMTISSEVDERTLRELYLVPFEAAVRPVDEGGADVRSLMSSYNRVNGTYASEHVPLLRGVLRDEWGFDGVVFSDWYGTHSAAQSLEASLDLEMPGPARLRGEQLLDAVLRGEVAETARRRSGASPARTCSQWCGIGDDLAGWRDDETTDDSPQTRDVIRRAAIAGTVLLKNDRSLLPVAAGAHGRADRPERRARSHPGWWQRPSASQPAGCPAGGAAGARRRRHVRAGLFDRQAAAGAAWRVRGRRTPVAAARAPTVATDRLQFIWMDDAGAGHRQGRVRRDASPARSSPTSTGDWQFGLTAVGRGRAARRRRGRRRPVDAADRRSVLRAGQPRDPRARRRSRRACRAASTSTTPYLELRHAARPDRRRRAARHRRHHRCRGPRRLRRADVAVVVVGTNDDWETEGEDRVDMDPARPAGRADRAGRRRQPEHDRRDQRRLAGHDAVARRVAAVHAGVVPR